MKTPLLPNFYGRFNVGGINIDTYRIFRMYEVADPCLQHAIKKLLRCGRSHKSREQDIQDAIDTLRRLQVMDEEDAPNIVACADYTSPIVEERYETTYSVHYFPVSPDWHAENGLDTSAWNGPGWYIVASCPFADTLGCVSYLSRESALAYANEEGFQWKYGAYHAPESDSTEK